MITFHSMVKYYYLNRSTMIQRLFPEYDHDIEWYHVITTDIIQTLYIPYYPLPHSVPHLYTTLLHHYSTHNLLYQQVLYGTLSIELIDSENSYIITLYFIERLTANSNLHSFTITITTPIISHFLFHFSHLFFHNSIILILIQNFSFFRFNNSYFL